MDKLKNMLKVVTQPTGIKILLAVLAALGINPDIATAISALVPLADSFVQSAGALVAGGLVIKELAKDETKKSKKK